LQRRATTITEATVVATAAATGSQMSLAHARVAVPPERRAPQTLFLRF